MDEKQFPCEKCGAELLFDVDSGQLECQYCGETSEIPASNEKVEELNIEEFLEKATQEEEFEERRSIECSSCGAKTLCEEKDSSMLCPFCGSAIVIAGGSTKVIKPRSLIPFQVSSEKAVLLFRKWLKNRWFAPNSLKKLARKPDTLRGILVPHWTYDCEAVSCYTGAIGIYHTGRNLRWYPANGAVSKPYNDILIPATQSLPSKISAKLEPWDLSGLVSYNDAYLSGFEVESYSVDLLDGLATMKSIIGDQKDSIRKDIGGDKQRIYSVKVMFSNVTFKHILLPVWISAYRFKKKVYRFLVNGQSGEVQGERPWSWVKIALAVLTAAAIGYAIGLDTILKACIYSII